MSLNTDQIPAHYDFSDSPGDVVAINVATMRGVNLPLLLANARFYITNAAPDIIVQTCNILVNRDNGKILDLSARSFQTDHPLADVVAIEVRRHTETEAVHTLRIIENNTLSETTKNVIKNTIDSYMAENKLA